MCDNYRIEPFLKVSVKGENGPFRILETKEEATDFYDGDVDNEYDVDVIYITQYPFKHLD